MSMPEPIITRHDLEIASKKFLAALAAERGARPVTLARVRAMEGEMKPEETPETSTTGEPAEPRRRHGGWPRGVPRGPRKKPEAEAAPLKQPRRRAAAPRAVAEKSAPPHGASAAQLAAWIKRNRINADEVLALLELFCAE
jgi:hypothetical protein